MIVYMAAPIDFNKGSDVNEHKVQIKKYFSKVEGAWVYDPSKAWTAPADLDPDARVHWTNISVLNQSDLVVAVLVRGVLTVGTVLEIQAAWERNIPVIVVGDIGQNSVGLEALEVPIFESIADVDESFVIDELMAKRKEQRERFTLHPTNGNVTITY